MLVVLEIVAPWVLSFVDILIFRISWSVERAEIVNIFFFDRTFWLKNFLGIIFESIWDWWSFRKGFKRMSSWFLIFYDLSQKYKGFRDCFRSSLEIILELFVETFTGGTGCWYSIRNLTPCSSFMVTSDSLSIKYFLNSGTFLSQLSKVN